MSLQPSLLADVNARVVVVSLRHGWRYHGDGKLLATGQMFGVSKGGIRSCFEQGWDGYDDL